MSDVMIRAGGLEVVMRGDVCSPVAAQIARVLLQAAFDVEGPAPSTPRMECARCGRTDRSTGYGKSWHWVAPDRCSDCCKPELEPAERPAERRKPAKRAVKSAVKRAAAASKKVEKEEVAPVLPTEIDPDQTQTDNILATLVTLGGKATTAQIRARLEAEEIKLRDSEPSATLSYLQKQGRVKSMGRADGWAVVE